MNEVQGWIAGRLPDEWTEGDVTVTVDREEILVMLPLAAPEVEGDDTTRRAAESGRITRFREDTRAERMRIADEAEHRFGRDAGPSRRARTRDRHYDASWAGPMPGAVPTLSGSTICISVSSCVR